MSSADLVNFQSLNMVRDELLATIDTATSDLEVFVGSQDDERSLQACVDGIRQLVGILKLLEFRGASLLAEELLATASDIAPGEASVPFEKRLEAISSGFFTLSRYLTYVQRAQRTVPVLLIPSINQLRKLRGEPPLLESHFFSVSLKNRPQIPSVSSPAVSPENFKPLIKRLRHMYQLGLLAVLRQDASRPALMMMHRALQRLQGAAEGKPLQLLWWLGSLALDAMNRQGMELIETRRTLLARLDRVIKEVSKGGAAALNAEAPKGLVKELLYLLNLSGLESEEIDHLRQVYRITPPPYDESELARERQALGGPSAHTVSSLVRVLRTELGHTKKVLEGASQAEGFLDDLDGFTLTLEKIAEILLVVGLSSAGEALKKETVRVKTWKGGDIGEELQAIAGTLLYVESAVGNLEYTDLAAAQLAEASEIMQQEVIASSLLAEAQRIVVQECEAALSLTMRALNAYSESSFDSGHIRNIAKTLNGVRGGMLMMKRDTAADILGRCVQFVDDVLMQPHHPPAIQELLETFADAITSVEYYLDTGGYRSTGDETVLQLAEDSLRALGYSREHR